MGGSRLKIRKSRVERMVEDCERLLGPDPYNGKSAYGQKVGHVKTNPKLLAYCKKVETGQIDIGMIVYVELNDGEITVAPIRVKGIKPSNHTCSMRKPANTVDFLKRAEQHAEYQRS